MKPEKTVNFNAMFYLEGGTDENNLPGYQYADTNGNPVCCSVWVPTEEERKLIADGSNNIRVVIWGKTVPPMDVHLTDEALGDPPPPKLTNRCVLEDCNNYVACATQGYCIESLRKR
jgi:hypothetical protein